MSDRQLDFSTWPQSEAAININNKRICQNDDNVNIDRTAVCFFTAVCSLLYAVTVGSMGLKLAVGTEYCTCLCSLEYLSSNLLQEGSHSIAKQKTELLYNAVSWNITLTTIWGTRCWSVWDRVGWLSKEEEDCS